MWVANDAAWDEFLVTTSFLKLQEILVLDLRGHYHLAYIFK